MLDFAQVTLLAAGAVVVIQQVLKLNAVPVSFANRYPVFTNIALSILAAVYVKWQDLVNLSGVNDWLVQVGLVAVIAAVTYNQLIGRSAAIKSTEGEGRL